MIAWKSAIYKALLTLAWTSVLIFFAWSAGAIYYLTYLPTVISGLLTATYLIGGVILLVRLPNKTTWLSTAAASIIVVYMATLFQRPSNDRDWDPAQTLAPSIVVSENDVTIKNYRHCVYRTEYEFDPHFRQLTFQLDQLESVWFLVQKFSPLEGMAHTFLSFGYRTPQGVRYFSVSVEIRRERGEIYSPLRGLYRQFELYYVVGDERDLIGVRTVMRPSDRVHMYRVNASSEDVQKLFLDIARRVNRLRDHPEFYHTLLNNCTNGIVYHTYDLTPETIRWWDPRVVLPGYSDRVAYAHGLIGSQEQEFGQLKQQARIDAAARKAGLTEQFSDAIRQAIPHAIE